MTRVTFGKTSWDSNHRGANNGSDDFLSINKDGHYEIRVIAEAPSEFAVHWVDDENGNSRRVKCAGPDCVLCKEGHKPSLRYLLEVISRDEEAPKLVEFGPQVFNGIVALRDSKHWGDPRMYDILIDREKKRGPSDMYKVMAIGSKAPLSPEDEEMAKEFLERIEPVVVKVSAAATNEEILEKLGRTPGSTPEKSPEPDLDVSSDDTDFDF